MAPCKNWDATIDPDRPEGLGPRDYQLKCNASFDEDRRDAAWACRRLQSGAQLSGLVANDNTYIDGQKFSRLGPSPHLHPGEGR